MKRQMYQLYRKIINKKYREKYKNGDISIISMNCIGAIIYNDLGLKFNSPMVNLFLYMPDYIKFLKDMKKYLDLDLEEIKNSKYIEEFDYPIGRLGDIEIHFMHYENFEEAKNKWNIRKERIDYEKLYIIGTDRDLCTEKLLLEFDKLPMKNKVIFTSKKYENIKSAVFLKKYKNKSQIGDTTVYRNYEKGFDLIKWLNTGLIEKK